MRPRLRNTATLLAVLAAALTATTSSLVGTALAGPGNDTVQDVRITFRVTGCDGCQIGLYQLHRDPEGGPTDNWGKTTRVKRGKAVLTVPADRTHGTAISIRAPWQKGFVHGSYYVATRYGGFDSGDSVTSKQAARARRGTYCWAGTDENQTIRIRVDRFRFDAVGTDEAGVAPRAFANPTLSTGTAELIRTWNGTFVSTYPVCPAP